MARIGTSIRVYFCLPARMASSGVLISACDGAEAADGEGSYAYK